MKKLTFILICLFLFNISGYSQDISTRGEIYDYEIGDIFHFEEYSSVGGGASGHWKMEIDSIIDKYYSVNYDTLFYLIYHHFATISEWYPYWIYDTTIYLRVYPNLDLPIFYGNIDTVYTNPNLYNGRVINYTEYSSVPSSHFDEYVEGCGMTGDRWESNNYASEEDRYLVYFKKGEEEWGSPLIIVNTDEYSADEFNILIYPNPVLHEFNIDLKNSNVRFDKVDLYSIKGELLMSQKIESDQINQINIPEIKKGLYIIKLISENEIFSSKIIKK